MKRYGIVAALAVLALSAGCSRDEKGDNVDEGKGLPETKKEIVVDNGLKSVPNVVIDDKGNPVLNDDGTPKKEGEKPGPVYNGKLPKAVEGSWAINQSDCARGSGETRIRVGPSQVIFYEAHANVKKVETVGAMTVADMDITSEGQSLSEQHKLSVTDGGKALKYDRGGEIFTYQKCAL